MTTATKDERAEAVMHLRKILKPGDTVYTVLRHVSSSGMTRRIDLYVIRKNALMYLSGYAAKAIGLRRHRTREGIVVGGCGMDMGYHLVYELGAVLWPKGTPKPHGRRNGEPDSEGGYALHHKWI